MVQLAERRDVGLRASRDRLAHMLGVHPRQLGALTPELVERITRHLNVLNRRLQNLVDTGSLDEMTGALRRPAGLEALERELHRARRFGDTRLVVAFIDVDGLKNVNDTAGHAAGDMLIREVSSTLRTRLRAYDLVVRWGGDEFICVLPEAGLRGALRILEEIAADFQERTGCSFSAGFAELTGSESAAEMVGRADAQLYEGRRRRRTPGPPGRRLGSRRWAALLAAATCLGGVLIVTLAPARSPLALPRSAVHQLVSHP